LIRYHTGVSYKTQDRKIGGKGCWLVLEEGKRFREVGSADVFVVIDGCLRLISNQANLFDFKSSAILLPRTYIMQKQWPYGNSIPHKTYFAK